MANNVFFLPLWLYKGDSFSFNSMSTCLNKVPLFKCGKFVPFPCHNSCWDEDPGSAEGNYLFSNSTNILTLMNLDRRGMSNCSLGFTL